MGNIPLGVYRHYKGNSYKVVGFARHSETLEDMVIYKALYGERGTWARPLSMWDNPVGTHGDAVKRFEYIGEDPPVMRRNDREVSDKAGVEEILSRCRICHVAMSDDGSPYVVPLSFGFRFTGENELELYFHSAAEGRKTDILKRCNRVCFETAFEGEPVRSETPCDSGYYFSSVIGFGEAMFIEDPGEKCAALSELYRHQTGISVTFTAEQAATVCVFKIISRDFKGKKKSGPP